MVPASCPNPGFSEVNHVRELAPPGRASELRANYVFMVACIGPRATQNCEPRQARKGAAAAVDACAVVWLVRAAPISEAVW